MYNKLPAIKMNKQTDKEKETDKLTCNKEDRRIHKKVCICDNKKKHQYLPTTIISTKNPATQITYKKPYTKTQIDTNTDTDTDTDTNTDRDTDTDKDIVEKSDRRINKIVNIYIN